MKNSFFDDEPEELPSEKPSSDLLHFKSPRIYEHQGPVLSKDRLFEILKDGKYHSAKELEETLPGGL